MGTVCHIRAVYKEEAELEPSWQQCDISPFTGVSDVNPKCLYLHAMRSCVHVCLLSGWGDDTHVLLMAATEMTGNYVFFFSFFIKEMLTDCPTVLKPGTIRKLHETEMCVPNVISKSGRVQMAVCTENINVGGKRMWCFIVELRCRWQLCFYLRKLYVCYIQTRGMQEVKYPDYMSWGRTG